MSPAANSYARLLREHQLLVDAGQGDSAMADALTDQMDGPWYAMTAEEQDQMQQLSEDLYTQGKAGSSP